MGNDQHQPQFPALAPGRTAGYLLTIVIGFVLLGGVYMATLPPFEGPDEAQHFAYIRWLAEGRGFPPQDQAWSTPIEQEAGQPPFYYLLASLPARLINLDEPPATYRPNPYFPAPMPRTRPDNDNRAIPYPGDADPLRGGWLALYAARAISLLFGTVLVVAVYGLTREVIPGTPWLWLAAAFLAAFTPQVLYISSVASNDIPAAAGSALALWGLARLLRRGPTARWAALTGVTWGLAILSKVSALTLMVPIAAGLVWLWLSGREPLDRVARTAVILGGATATTAGWWFLRSLWLYGSLFGIETHDLTPWAIRSPDQVGPLFPRWLEVGRSYWIAIGWGTIRPAPWVYNVLALLAGLAVAGLAGAGWRAWRRRPAGWGTTAVMLGLLTLLLLAEAAFLEMWMHRVVAPYGRLLFPALTAIILLLLLGWRAIHPGLVVASCTFVFGLAVATPWLVIQPAYTRPPALTTNELAIRPNQLAMRFGPAPEQPLAELVSVNPARRSVAPPAVLPVEVCWRTLGTTSRNYTVLLHVIGPDNSLIANRRSYHGQGLYPTAIWETGQAFCDVMHVVIWDPVAAARVFHVEVALYDEATRQRLPVFDRSGNLVPHTFVSRIRLAPNRLPAAPLLADDHPIQLVDYELNRTWHPGETQLFRLKWGVAAPVAADYQVFVHLQDQGQIEPAAQADGPPVGGWYPTSWWTAGELVVDDHLFALPASVPPGDYQLLVGLYDLATGERLGPVESLGTITVAAPTANP